MRTLSVILGFLLVLGPTAADGSASDDRAGQAYKAELARLIDRSDKIVVTEHSFELDLYDLKANKSLIPTEAVYGTRVLTAEQRRRFAAEIRVLDGTTQDAFSGCIFEPHHRITFYSKNKKLSTMEICFKCSQIEWSSSRTTPPWAIYPGLGSFIRSIGIQPEQDWQARAKLAVSQKR